MLVNVKHVFNALLMWIVLEIYDEMNPAEEPESQVRGKNNG